MNHYITGSTIRELREKKKMTQAELAGRLDVSDKTISKWETSKGLPDISLIEPLAKVLGISVVELLTGDNPHLSHYAVARKGEGIHIKRRAGFEYLHKASHLRGKLAEPFVVTAPYLEEEQDVPVHLSRHEGQELDFIISGQMRFAYEDHEEILNPGDVVMYDSGRGHGMIATGGEPCVFLAIVMKPEGEKII